MFFLILLAFVFLRRRTKPYNFEDRLRELAEHLQDADGLRKPREIRRDAVRLLTVRRLDGWGGRAGQEDTKLFITWLSSFVGATDTLCAAAVTWSLPAHVVNPSKSFSLGSVETRRRQLGRGPQGPAGRAP